jgi:hypothetical protein
MDNPRRRTEAARQRHHRTMNTRRHFVATLIGWGAAHRSVRAQDTALAGQRSGGAVLLLRHAQTDPGAVTRPASSSAAAAPSAT